MDPKNENTLVESYNCIFFIVFVFSINILSTVLYVCSQFVVHITYPTVEEISLSIDALSLAHNPKRRQTFRLQTKVLSIQKQLKCLLSESVSYVFKYEIVLTG